MSKCKETVPNLIGQLREKRLTNSGIALPVGYRNKELLGRQESEGWKKQLLLND